MNKSSHMPKVLIAGAGLSGLAAAITLQRAGLQPIIYEALPEVGGRVRTRQEKGFLIDEGFQVLLSSYPELTRFVDLKKLQLQKFNSGAKIFNGNKLELLANPLIHPESLLSTFSSEYISGKDRALVLKLIAQSQFVDSELPLLGPTTEDFLKKFGFSEDFIENFWRPFLTGVYLDPRLQVSSRFFEFLIGCFSLGRVSIPAEGMQALPRLMASELSPEALRLGSVVSEIQPKRLILKDGSVAEADIVISSLPDHPSEEAWHSVSTYYFTCPQNDLEDLGKWLSLVPRRWSLSVDHFCNLGAVAKSYGQGQALLSASSVAKEPPPVHQIISELQGLLNKKIELQLVTTAHVRRALPKNIVAGEGYGIENGVYRCGDGWCSPSINGALKSGRFVAERILKDYSIISSRAKPCL